MEAIKTLASSATIPMAIKATNTKSKTISMFIRLQLKQWCYRFIGSILFGCPVGYCFSLYHCLFSMCFLEIISRGVVPTDEIFSPIKPEMPFARDWKPANRSSGFVEQITFLFF